MIGPKCGPNFAKNVIFSKEMTEDAQQANLSDLGRCQEIHHMHFEQV